MNNEHQRAHLEIQLKTINIDLGGGNLTPERRLYLQREIFRIKSQLNAMKKTPLLDTAPELRGQEIRT